MKSESVSLSVVSDSAAPWTVAGQAPRSTEFQARILEWVAVPFSGELWFHRYASKIRTSQDGGMCLEDLHLLCRRHWAKQ